jgi:hypothetical protein
MCSKVFPPRNPSCWRAGVALPIRHEPRRLLATLALMLLAVPAFRVPCSGAVQILGAQYQPDELFPEYNCLWHDRNYPSSCPGTALGANVHVYLKNTGASAITINDVTLAGYSLTTILPVSTTAHNANSIYFYWDNPPADILAAGTPVWFKGDPKTIPAGGVAQAVVRLRSPPTTPTVAVGVVTSIGPVTTNITIDPGAPQLASVGFAQDRSTVYLHWRRAPLAGSGAAPTTVWLDGVDVTANTTTVGDATMNFAVSAIHLAAPLPFMSYHVFQGVFPDGKRATASLRAWSHPFLHASWGVFNVADGDVAGGQAWLQSALDRGFNAVQNQYGGGVGDFLASPSGGTWMAQKGFGVIVWNGNTSRNTLMTFIDDEVDAEEDNVANNFCGTGKKLPCGASPMGILGLRSIATGEDWRRLAPDAPTTINMDGTFKPENYYAYGQAVDVLQSDPYYQKRLKDTYWYHYPEWVPLYNKATYIYAVTKAGTRAAEPNPYHVILNSTESREDVNGVNMTWPFADPRCKRVEVYYALAGGAKGISYWWFTPCGGNCSNGLGDQSKQTARDLWKEMGLYGNEIKTVSPLLVISHPVDAPLSPGANVWARALAVGTDTLILLVVNDNYWNDQTFHSTDVPNATVTVTLPAWLQPAPTAFEVTAGGIYNVNTQSAGNQLQLNLGTLKVTRMIVLTRDAALLSALQRRYDAECRPGLCAFAPESCTNIPLTVAQQPANLVLNPGGSGSFTVAAFGTGLKYQWQKNLGNLSDGGHYSGCTNATLTVSGADANDQASYRCVVYTGYATNNSNPATLSLTTNAPAAPVANPATNVSTNSFTANWSSATNATGYRLDVSTNNGFANFVAGYQNRDVGNTLSWNVSGLAFGPTYYYRVRAYNPNGASGNSAVISVTLSTPATCPPVGLVNADFEGGTNANGSAAGWTAYEVNSPSVKVWSVQSSLPAPGGGQYQQIQAYSADHTASAGVRQNITGCIVGATYQISGWYRSNSDFGRARVRVSPSASSDWTTAVDLNPVADYGSSTNWATFSGTVVATGTNMTLWLDGRTISGTSGKVGCFDSITISCALINVPPNITQQPASQSVGVGGTAGFTVQAVGTEPLTYRWLKNNTNFSDGGHYAGVATPTLTITGADADDAATYRCVITNAFGSSNSLPATLTVTNLSLPPIFTQQPLDQSVFPGGDASFFVAAEGAPPLAYQWRKNDTDLADGGHYSGAATPTLNITGADANDFATYRCVVTNAYGTNISNAATLSAIVISPCFGLANADFEGGFSLAGGGYIANHWTEWEADPDVIVGYDETTLTHGGGHAQRLRVWGGAGGSAGGIYQRVPVTAGQPFSITLWTYAGDNLTTCSVGVDATGETDPGSAVWSAGSTNVAWVPQTVTGTAGADYLTVFCRVASSDDAKRNGYFDDGTPAAAGGPLQLLVQRSGNNLTLTWPECPDAALEQTESLLPPVHWTPVTNDVTVADGQKTVTLTPTGGAGYFRLVSQ